jgi:hypothetical protein
LFAGDASLERLDVGQVSFRLDDGLEGTLDADDRIRAATIAFDRHRDLCAPSKGGTKTRSEPLEESQVCLVSDRVSVRMQRDVELESKDRRHSCREFDRQGVGISTLGASDPSVSSADPASDLAKAQPTGSPSRGQTVGRPRDEHPAAPRATFGRSVPDRHPVIIATSPLLPIIACDPAFGALAPGRPVG